MCRGSFIVPHDLVEFQLDASHLPKIDSPDMSFQIHLSHSAFPRIAHSFAPEGQSQGDNAELRLITYAGEENILRASIRITNRRSGVPAVDLTVVEMACIKDSWSLSRSSCSFMLLFFSYIPRTMLMSITRDSRLALDEWRIVRNKAASSDSWFFCMEKASIKMDRFN